MPGTISGLSDFDPAAIAETLREAMQGFGTNEEQITCTVSQMTNAQRQEVAEAFKQSYGKDLIDDLKSELGGDFEEVVVAAMMLPRAYDAKQIHDAMSGVGTKEKTLIEIMCTRNNEEIGQIKEAYQAEYEEDLEGALCSDTGGYFERMLVSLCTGGREENDGDIDEDKAKEDAQRFHDAGEGCWGTEEAELNAILCQRSPEQLRATIDEYERLHETTMEEAIDTECGGDLKTGFLTLVEVAKSPARYFAKRAHDAMAGFGTSDTDLIRVIVSRSEVDLDSVKDEYQEMYGQSLSEAVEGDCGGNYKRMLLSLISPTY